MKVKQNYLSSEEKAKGQADLSEWLKSVGCPPAIHDLDAPIFLIRDFDPADWSAEAVEAVRVVEFKMRGARMTQSQVRSLNFLDESLRTGCYRNRYHGTWCIAFQGQSPCESEFAYVSSAPTWERRKLPIEQVKQLLSLHDVSMDRNYLKT